MAQHVTERKTGRRKTSSELRLLMEESEIDEEQSIVEDSVEEEDQLDLQMAGYPQEFDPLPIPSRRNSRGRAQEQYPRPTEEPVGENLSGAGGA